MQDCTTTNIREVSSNCIMDDTQPQPSPEPEPVLWETSILESSTVTLEQSAKYLQDLVQILITQSSLDDSTGVNSDIPQNTLPYQIVQVTQNHTADDDDENISCNDSCTSESLPSQADTSVDDDESTADSEMTASDSIVSYETCSNGSIEVTDANITQLPQQYRCPPSPTRAETDNGPSTFLENTYLVVCDACAPCAKSPCPGIGRNEANNKNECEDQVILDGSKILDSLELSEHTDDEDSDGCENAEEIENEETFSSIEPGTRSPEDANEAKNMDLQSEPSGDAVRDEETNPTLEKVRQRSVSFRPDVVSQEIVFETPNAEEKMFLFYTGRELHQFRIDYIMELHGYDDDKIRGSCSPSDQMSREEMSGMGSMRMFWSLYAALLRLLTCSGIAPFCCGAPQPKNVVV